MLKTALKYILVLAVIVTVASVVFAKSADACGSLFRVPESAETAERERAAGLKSLDDGRAVVYGRYAAGAETGYTYYRIFDRTGASRGSGSLHIDGASLEITDVLTETEARDADFQLVCLVTPRDETQTAYGAVYTVGKDGGVSEPTLFRGDENEALYGFERFAAADEAGTCFAGIYNQRVVLFDAEGGVLLRLSAVQMTDVTDVCRSGENFILAGCAAESGLEKTAYRAFTICYNAEGTALWEQRLMGGEDEGMASALRVEPEPDGSLLFYGRYADEPREAAAVSAQLEAFSLYEGAMRFFVGTDTEQELSSSAFLIRTDAEGKVQDRVVYEAGSSTAVPSFAGYRAERERDGISLISYTAKKETADSYQILLLRLDRDLRETKRVRLTVPGDTAAYCEADGAEKEDGLWLYGGVGTPTEMLHFASASEAASYFGKVRICRPVCEAWMRLRRGIPLLLSLYAIMTVCAMGVSRGGKRRK